MSDFQTPSSLPFLTEEYIRNHAWYPVDRFFLEEQPEFIDHRLWGRIPCKNRTEYRAGDIIVFVDYRTNELGDRYLIVSQQHIDEVFSGSPENRIRTKEQLMRHLAEKTELLPVGVVVYPPSTNTIYIDRRDASLLLTRLVS